MSAVKHSRVCINCPSRLFSWLRSGDRKTQNYPTGLPDMRTTTFNRLTLQWHTRANPRWYFFSFPLLHIQQQHIWSGGEKGRGDWPGAASFDRWQPTTSFALFWAGMKDGEGPRVKPGGAMAPGVCKFFLRLRGAASIAAGALIVQRK